MFKIIEDWQTRCKGVEISLSELCRRAGANRKTVERLKERIPKSLKTYLTIEKQLGELEKAKAKAAAASGTGTN